MDGDLSMIMERAANETVLECDRFGDCFESDHVPFWLTKVRLPDSDENSCSLLTMFNRLDK